MKSLIVRGCTAVLQSNCALASLKKAFNKGLVYSYRLLLNEGG